jgi:glucose/arabinose dehydrogenase
LSAFTLAPTSVSDFVTGWLADGSFWGRPVDLVQGTDGAFYISDDQAGVIYRLGYQA